MNTDNDTRIRQYWETSTPMNFSDEKWTYEQKREFRYDLQDYMAQSFEFNKWRGKRVLEVGCGSGIDAVEFSRHEAIVTAVDITANAVRLTEELSRESGFPVRAIRVDSSDQLPFAPLEYDCVYSYGVLHHIPDVKATLSEIYRVLKRGGTFMGMVYNMDSLLFAYSILYLHGMLDNEFDGDPVKLASKYSERNIGCPYTRCYTKSEAADLLKEVGFTDVSVETHFNVIDTPKQRKVKINMATEELGWHLVLRAKK